MGELFNHGPRAPDYFFESELNTRFTKALSDCLWASYRCAFKRSINNKEWPAGRNCLKTHDSGTRSGGIPRDAE